MATLSSALNYALSGLSVTAAQSAIVSRNVSFAGDENYTRKSAEIYALPGGAPAISNFNRSTDKLLLDKLIQSSSSSSGKNVLVDVLNRMSALSGDPEADGSLAASLSQLQQSLKTYETNPSDVSLAGAAVESARSVVQAINTAALEVSSIRSDADRAMRDSVDRVNTLLSQFKVVNDSIVRGQGTPGDLGENLDQRDSILKLLSEELSIRTTTRPNNDVLIYAEGGAVLFEGNPRTVSMKTTEVFDETTRGKAVYIDGVAVTGPLAPMPITGGRLAALAEARDVLAPGFGNQIDLIAGGLIRGFAESDRSASPSLPDVAGLFVDRDGTLPQAGELISGIASRLSLNSLADPQEGGSALLLRDGGFGGPNYVANRLGQSSYQGRIGELIESFDRISDYGNATPIGGSTTLIALSVQSSAWVEAMRQSASKDADLATATQVRASESLLRITGVNIDQEMAALLDLEKSYQASSKIISIVDSMLATLMNAVG